MLLLATGNVIILSRNIHISGSRFQWRIIHWVPLITSKTMQKKVGAR